MDRAGHYLTQPFGIYSHLLAMLLLIKKLIPGFVKIQVKKSRSTEDSVLIKKRPFAPLAHLGPGLLIYHLMPVFFNIDTRFLSVFQQPGGNDIEKLLPAQA